MKFIKINESQKNRLFEGYREGFSFDELASLSFKTTLNNKIQYDYCLKWLGKPCGKGSSRIVFMLDDNMVLKLAYCNSYFGSNDGILGGVGTAQNRAEYEVYVKVDSPLLPRILYHDDNFTFIVSEHVLPATEEDFEKILGYPFLYTYTQNSIKIKNLESPNEGDLHIGFNKYFDNIKKPYEWSDVSISDILEYLHGKYIEGDDYSDKELDKIIYSSPWLIELKKLIMKTKMSDFCQIENFGIVNRDGNPSIVILDSGLNIDLWEKYY